jgi:hypothetical protein
MIVTTLNLSNMGQPIQIVLTVTRVTFKMRTVTTVISAMSQLLRKYKMPSLQATKTVMVVILYLHILKAVEIVTIIQILLALPQMLTVTIYCMAILSHKGSARQIIMPVYPTQAVIQAFVRTHHHHKAVKLMATVPNLV